MPALLLTLIALLIAARANEAQVLLPGVRAAAERISAEQLSRDIDYLVYPRTDAGPFLERSILTIGFFR